MPSYKKLRSYLFNTLNESKFEDNPMKLWMLRL